MSDGENQADVEKLWVATQARRNLFGLQLEAVRIGRYVLLEEVGHGAMGIVYAAYDATLDRKVAIKLVHSERAQSADARRRLLREAKAMARLSHANIVHVYEAAEHEGRLFLVMELVDGTTVREWLRATDPRPGWRQVLELFLGVARGLAEAHRAGIVHRDLKPDNILVAGSEAKVADFGLAGLDERADSVEPSPPSSDRDARGTATGGLVGTPLYMAPEQHAGRQATPASDQFAFCVTLWESLANEPPFPGTSAPEIEHAVRHEPPRPLPKSAKVPRQVREALERGMAVEVEKRWPSMDALADALARSLRNRRRGRLVGGTALVAASVGAVAWASGPATCSGAEAKLAGVWDATRRAEVEGAFSATAVPYAEGAWLHVEARLDVYAGAWIGAHTEACEATTVRGDRSAEAMDLSIACLDRARVDLGAVVDTLSQADVQVVRRAHNIVAALPRLDACSNVEALRAEVAPAPEHEVAGVEHVRATLAEARALQAAGKYELGAAAVQRAQSVQAGLEYEPTSTEVLLVLGKIREAQGDYEGGVEALEGAQRVGARLGQWDEVRSATTLLVFVLGHRLARHGEAMLAANLARGLAERSGDLLDMATFEHRLASALAAHGELADAVAAYDRALEGSESVLGPDHVRIATHLSNRAIALLSQGEWKRAEEDHARALRIHERALGPTHPLVAATRSNIGFALYRKGNYTEAERELRAAVELRTLALGAEHPETAASRSDLALVLKARGQFTAAEAENRAVLAIREAVLSPDHADVALSHLNLGAVLGDQERDAEALVEHRAALALFLKKLGPNHTSVAVARNNVANSLGLQGEFEAALVEYGLALEAMRNTLGSEHVDVAQVQNNIAELHLKRGDNRAAEAGYRAALAVREKQLPADHPHVAQSHHGLAKALAARAAWDDAEAEYRVALTILRKALPSGHARITITETDLGDLLVRRGRAEEALEVLEEAWKTCENREDAPTQTRAEAAFALARALWARGQRPRARELAQQAEGIYASGPERLHAEATNVAAWLKKHR